MQHFITTFNFQSRAFQPPMDSNDREARGWKNLLLRRHRNLCPLGADSRALYESANDRQPWSRVSQTCEGFEGQIWQTVLFCSLDPAFYTIYIGRHAGWHEKFGPQVQVFEGRRGEVYFSCFNSLVVDFWLGIIFWKSLPSPSQMGLTQFYTEVAFCPFSQFFLDEPAFRKNIFISNQLDFECDFITNNSWKFKVSKVEENFPILRLAKVTFRNLGIFQAIIISNDVIRRFCSVINLTSAFYDSVLKINQGTKFEPPVTSSQKWCQFSKLWPLRHYNDVINLKLCFWKRWTNTNQHQLCSSHSFWFKSYLKIRVEAFLPSPLVKCVVK